MNIKEIEKVLKSQYDVNGFTALVREIFPDMAVISPNRKIATASNYSSHIEGHYNIGKYEDPEGKTLLIFAVELKKESYVENSRSTQRNFAKLLIENGGADAAFIAFFTKDDPKWRISFVRLDYELKVENGKLATVENLTPAKRYSYLVGENEPCHTAISRFHRFLVDDLEIRPTLDDIEEAFSVEKVTDEFFKLYCEKYHELREALENNEDFIAEASEHNFTSAQFAKKLMGQIVFLYFLQKKGWLGVNTWPVTLTKKQYTNMNFAFTGVKNRLVKQYLPQVFLQESEDVYRLQPKMLESIPDDAEEYIALALPGKKAWGTGPKDFMRRLFKASQKDNKNFYDEYLEPLFYNALNVNRGDTGYDPILHCRIPFLSGGLFEPIDGYDWKNAKFSIPNDIFSNKTDDIEGNGILDIFDRYNFTMSEDEPLEREVAIDPEMLGKVFENLLDVTDRKSKGAFYTPREIVHYMCQESLISYIVRETGISEQAVRDFITMGEFMKDADTTADRKRGQSEMFISDEIYKLGADCIPVVNRLVDIDNALKTIRVADPAVGSGAFPLGMLNEIVKARTNISAYMALTMNAYNRRMMYSTNRSPYLLKVETIKNCIFAADIDPSAVDIAQLRLWLSIVIDDEINPNADNPVDGHRNPIPLPNLECNIVCGNSLLDMIDGNKLINQSELIGTQGGQLNLYQSTYDVLIPQLLAAQDELFRCSDTNRKHELLTIIEGIKDRLIMSQLAQASNETKEKYRQTKSMASKPYLLWQLEFARVFREKGGFDVVIGNPPYVDSEEMTRSMSQERIAYNDIYTSCKGNWDLFVPFVEKGISLLSEGAVISYIIPNKLISAPYTEEIRKIISKNQVQEIRDYSNVNVFKSAAVYPVVFRIQRCSNKTDVIMDVMEDMLNVQKHSTISPEKFYADIAWDKYFNASQIVLDIVEKMDKYPKLSSIASVNGAATVKEAYLVKDFLYECDECSDQVKKFINTGGIDRYKSLHGLDYIRYLKGKYMLPVVNCKDLCSMSEKRFNESNSPKIIIGGMNKWLECYYDDGEYLAGKSTTIVYNNPHLKYITAILNSKLMSFYYSVVFNSMSLAGGFYRIGTPQIKTLPIPQVNVQNLSMLEEYVDELQHLYKKEKYNNDIQKLEYTINQYVYQLYGLNDVEIQCVEQNMSE